MKTCLFSTSWLEGRDYSGSHRLERTQRYLRYYEPLKAELGFQDFWLADNASRWEDLRKLRGANVYRFDEWIPRNGGRDYADVWRGFYFVRELWRLGYEKIIYVETDAFILTRRMTRFIRELSEGFTSFWLPSCEFPAAEITVMCPDVRPLVERFMELDWRKRNDLRELYETALPFTAVPRDHIIGDRFGEIPGSPPPGTGMDFYSQAPLETRMRFEGSDASY